MAVELPRPGVEVVQEFTSAAPTVVTPTLVPCVIAPFFEVIEAVTSSGTTNPDAKMTTLYSQLEQLVLQSSFPSPRKNIDQVNVLEDTIRAFFDFGGALAELSRTAAFLTAFNDPEVSRQPYVEGTTTEGSTTGGYDLDGRSIILLVDSHTSLPPDIGHLPTAKNVTITFTATTPGGRLSLDQVVDQINALFPGLASRSVAGSSGKLHLASTKFGAHASVVVRYNGSANSGTDRLGFSAASDTFACGSGFYAYDDNDGDLTSPKLKIYVGNQQGTIAVPGAAYITVSSTFFHDASVEVGDNVYADGVDVGMVHLVESDQLTMEVEQNIVAHDNPFAPRRVRARANDLVYPAPAASSAGELTGLIQTALPTQAYVVGQSIFVGTASPSESLTVGCTVDGVAQPEETVSSGAGNWDALANCIASVNGQTSLFEAYKANSKGDESAVGTYLGLRTKAAMGSGAMITAVSSTVGTALGYTTLPVGDVGENIRFRPGIPAWNIMGGKVTPTAWTAGSGTTSGETNVYTPTWKGVAQPAETIIWGGTYANTLPGLDLAVANWNSQAFFTQAYRALSTGVASLTGTYFAVRTIGENIGTGAIFNKTGGTDSATLPTASVAGTSLDLNGKLFTWSLDHNPKVWAVTLVTDEDSEGLGAPGGVSLQQVIDKINTLTPGVAQEDSNYPPFLTLMSQKVGEASQVLIGTGDANAGLGFAGSASNNGNGRPAPDLAIDGDGNVVIQGQILRDGLTGVPFNPGSAPIYLSYKGLRLDMSPEADNPALIRLTDISTLELAANPVTTDNPGAVMAYLALLNAPAVEITAIGVPEVSADAPDGTPLGYAKCAEFLENEEVYALATASHINTVHQTFMTHVNVMSEPEQKGERIYFFNPTIPTRANPTLVGSGTDLNTTATANECTLDVNIAPALIAAGIDPNLDINPVTGEIEREVYVDIGTTDKVYLVQKVTNGTTLKLRTTFVAGDGNDDSFFSDEAFPTAVISDSWTVYIRGNELLIPGTTKPDRSKIAETLQAAAGACGFRRCFWVFPDQCAINITGLEQLVEGYYATACIVGMVGQLPPQQGFTNYPITGLSRIVGSNDKFTNRQLNVIAAGGVYILVQDAQNAPVICRHQLSTNMTSIETRELSITKVVDFVAKFMRGGLRNFIGRSNITQGFLDTLSTVIQGQLNFLVDGGVLIGADINNLVQDADAPDTVLVDVTLDVPYPCNYLRLTLVL
jgi:hypothetical protein